jgi:hypothetical protein
MVSWAWCASAQQDHVIGHGACCSCVSVAPAALASVWRLLLLRPCGACCSCVSVACGACCSVLHAHGVADGRRFGALPREQGRAPRARLLPGMVRVGYGCWSMVWSVWRMAAVTWYGPCMRGMALRGMGSCNRASQAGASMQSCCLLVQACNRAAC